MAAIIVMPTNINLGKSFLILKPANFKAINGKLLTISQLNVIMRPYKNHLFISISLMKLKLLPKCSISGNDATNNPTAGVGTPLNPYRWVVSKLNFASRYADAAARIKAGSNQAKATSRPFSSFIKLSLNNWYKITEGQTPKLTTSARESSCLPISEDASNSLDTKPSKKSTTAAAKINRDAKASFSGTLKLLVNSSLV